MGGAGEIDALHRWWGHLITSTGLVSRGALVM
jgi:hypothetical protein